MIKSRVVTATEVNRTRRTKSYLSSKSYDKESVERRSMIKQILDESDHRTNISCLLDNSDDEDDYLTRALSMTESPAIGSAKRGSASPQIQARKGARRTSTPTVIARKKNSFLVKNNHSTDSSAAGANDDTSTVTSDQSQARRRRGTRGDLPNYESQLSNSEHSSHHQQRRSSTTTTTPRMARRKSSRGDMPNDEFLTRARPVSVSVATTEAKPPPPPPPDGSIEFAKSSRNGRRRSCRGDIGMELLQYNVDDTSVSLNSLSLLSNSTHNAETVTRRSAGDDDDISVGPPKHIVERRRSCRGDMVMDHFQPADQLPCTVSGRSNRTADRMASAPRRASSFGTSSAASSMLSRRRTDSHTSIGTDSTTSKNRRKSSSMGNVPSKPRRRFSLNLFNSSDDAEKRPRTGETTSVSFSHHTTLDDLSTHAGDVSLPDNDNKSSINKG